MLFLKIVGSIVLMINFFWFVATLMTKPLKISDNDNEDSIHVIKKILLITFLVTSIWVSVIVWVVM